MQFRKKLLVFFLLGMATEVAHAASFPLLNHIRCTGWEKLTPEDQLSYRNVEATFSASNEYEIGNVQIETKTGHRRKYPETDFFDQPAYLCANRIQGIHLLNTQEKTIQYPVSADATLILVQTGEWPAYFTGYLVQGDMQLPIPLTCNRISTTPN